MTKRDYELIARVVSRLDPSVRNHAAWCFVVELRKENPKFNADTFLKACSVIELMVDWFHTHSTHT